MVNAEMTSSGELSFGGQIAGRIQGFRYTPDASSRTDLDAVDEAGMASAIAQEFEVRANRLSDAVDSALVLANDGAIRWLGEPIAKIATGETLLNPRALILADETLAGAAQQKAQGRVDLWLAAYVKRLLGPLFELEAGAGLEGPARNVASQLVENLGVVERGRVAQDVKALDQNARGMLRKLGVRFGAYYIYIPSLIKPAMRVLATQLWALRRGGAADGTSLHEIPQLAASGRTSFVADHTISRDVYRVAGFRICGDRAVRVDIVERLADLIRPAVAYRSGVSAGEPPAGSADGDGFVVTGAMTSLTGCSGEQFASVLRSLGFVNHFAKGPALTPVEKTAAPAEPVDGAPETEQSEPPFPEETPHAIDAEPALTIDPGRAMGAPDAAPGEVVGFPPAAAPTIDAASCGPSPTDLQDSAGNPVTALDDGAQAAAAEQVAEALIEIWRPRPPSRQRNARAGARERGAAQAQAQAADSQPALRKETSDEPGRRRRRPPPRPSPAQPSVEAESRTNREPDGRREDSGVRRRSRGSGRTQDSLAGRDAPRHGAAQDDRGRRERKQENASAAVARREPPVNLDSPFAKLLALKAQLEEKGRRE